MKPLYQSRSSTPYGMAGFRNREQGCGYGWVGAFSLCNGELSRLELDLVPAWWVKLLRTVRESVMSNVV